MNHTFTLCHHNSQQLPCRHVQSRQGLGLMRAPPPCSAAAWPCAAPQGISKMHAPAAGHQPSADAPAEHVPLGGAGARSCCTHGAPTCWSPEPAPACRRPRYITGRASCRAAQAPEHDIGRAECSSTTAERGRQEVDPRTAAEGASRARRRTGAGAIFRAERYSVAWRRTAQELPWCARADHSWRGAWRAFCRRSV